jgi:hypothetical protein
VALKHGEVRAGTRVFDRPFGALEIHGQPVRRAPGRGGDPHRDRQASMMLPEQSLLVYEMTPALFAAVAANEAERAAPRLRWTTCR